MNERWLPVVGFPKYIVSNMGKAKRIATDGGRKPDGRVLGSVNKTNGYTYIHLHSRELEKVICLHVLVCEAFIGPKPSLVHQVAHNDGNPANNRADNLRWATPKENCADKIAHGTQPMGVNHYHKTKPELTVRGENVHCAKLTEKQVRKIKDDTRIHKLIADDYGVTRRAITFIKQGITWSHVT